MLGSVELINFKKGESITSDNFVCDKEPAVEHLSVGLFRRIRRRLRTVDRISSSYRKLWIG